MAKAASAKWRMILKDNKGHTVKESKGNFLIPRKAICNGNKGWLKRPVADDDLKPVKRYGRNRGGAVSDAQPSF